MDGLGPFCLPARGFCNKVLALRLCCKTLAAHRRRLRRCPPQPDYADRDDDQRRRLGDADHRDVGEGRVGAEGAGLATNPDLRDPVDRETIHRVDGLIARRLGKFQCTAEAVKTRTEGKRRSPELAVPDVDDR